jgi:hypothetical protein
MSFNRESLPDPRDYYENWAFLPVKGRGPWITTRCEFHGGSDSMRINLKTGGFMCMSCGEKGGDVLAYHMRLANFDFVEAAKVLGAWTDDGKPSNYKPLPISARQMLEVVAFEVQIVAIIAADVCKGIAIGEVDRARLFEAAGRIGRVAEEFHHG